MRLKRRQHINIRQDKYIVYILCIELYELLYHKTMHKKINKNSVRASGVMKYNYIIPHIRDKMKYKISYGNGRDLCTAYTDISVLYMKEIKI